MHADSGEADRLARYALYGGLLASARAGDRIEGIDRWREHGLGVDEIDPLLADDSPVVIARDGRASIVEVRAVALVAVQDSYRLRGAVWNRGAVTVRAAMPAEDARRRADTVLAALDGPGRRDVSTRADRILAERVGPDPADADTCRAYLVLQLTGGVDYEVQPVSNVSLLTAVQERVHARQAAGERPRPHVRFDGPRGPVGYFYRYGGRWVLDLSEHPLAASARSRVDGWRGALRGGVPRLVLDADGTPRTDAAGHLVTEGVVPHDTEDPLPYLHSVAAFIAGQQPAELVP